MASPEAKNLEAISKAIDQHNANCPFPAAEVRMNPFEVERLGWDTIRGLPVVPDGETYQLDSDHIVRVGPAVKRKIVAGPDGLRLLALGATPGEAYEAGGTL